MEVAKEDFLRGVEGTITLPLKKSLEDINQLMTLNLSADQSKIVNNLNECLSHVYKSSQNLVHLADIKADSFTINKTPFNPITLFESIINSFTVKAKNAGVHLLAYIDPNAPKSITSDAQHITTVMKNLIENGISYTKKGGSVYVDMKIKHITDTQVSLHVAVSDTGVGIDKNAIKKYLKPLNSNAKEKLGLGLSTSFYILKAMNSKLKIASELNKGSRFSFVLDVQSSSKALFLTHPDIKIGVLIDDRNFFSYAKLLYQYIISMGLGVVSIKDRDDENIKECQGVFFVTDGSDTAGIKGLVKRYPQTCFIPTMKLSKLAEFEMLSCVKKVLSLPALPSQINQALAFIEKELPVEITQANKEDHQAIQTIAKQAEAKKVKILVVEDNPINLKLVKVILTRYNFEIDSAENGEIGVELCKNNRYDMVLMDIDMPVMDGITATKIIKAYEAEEGLPQTPIVALTSHDLAGERGDILESGLDEHMPKPLNIARLELMLESYIGYKPKRTK